MRALILAGGKGSRLRPFTFTIPKPLVPIGETPIIEILARQLAADGFDRITIAVGHLAGLIEGFCGDGSQWGVVVDYVREEEPLGTAGCLGLVPDLGEESILVVNGDTLTDLDFGVAFGFHEPSSGITICANTRTVPVDFGVLEVDDQGGLTGYSEKPTFSFPVSMGVNVVSGWVVRDRVTPGVRLDMPELVLSLVADGVPVRVHDPGAYWLDLGRMSDLEEGDRVFSGDPARFLRR
jgi:NDP-sugar pyrophosphorylase family protein